VLGKKGDENDFKNETFGDHLKNKDAENSDNVSSLKLLADRTRKFCSESSLHVIKYVADLNRHFLERYIYKKIYTEFAITAENIFEERFGQLCFF